MQSVTASKARKRQRRKKEEEEWSQKHVHIRSSAELSELRGKTLEKAVASCKHCIRSLLLEPRIFGREGRGLGSTFMKAKEISFEEKFEKDILTPT